jgi:hypothetical protein
LLAAVVSIDRCGEFAKGRHRGCRSGGWIAIDEDTRAINAVLVIIRPERDPQNIGV